MKTRLTLITVVVLLPLIVANVAVANGAPTIDWKVVASGGGHADAGIYALDGTIGQPVVGLDCNASKEVCAGFWCWVWTQFYRYLPIILR